MVSTTVLWAAILFIPFTISQETALPGPQCQDFASSYSLSASQISRADISNITAHNVETAINFERSNWATNSVAIDPFYRIPANWSSSLPPGTLLTVENMTNTSLYTLPASVSLSRITYQTETLNGTSVPASAYILWPYLARTFPAHPGLPVIGWGHGTSGTLPDCAPSHIRNLWYQYSAPFTMALQGYVVVAPDYAGLGISTTTNPPNGNSHAPTDDQPILHPWLAAPAQAADILHAVAAAQTAYAALSRSFVIVGHSQGGVAAWGAALRASSSSSVPGYLGAVAASPAPAGDEYLAFATGAGPGALAAYATYGVLAAYPEVAREELFTEEGLRRWELLEEVGGCSSVASQLFATPGVEVVRRGWGEHWAVRAFAERVEYGGKELAGGGPLLVMQGMEDPFVLAEWTGRAVRRTCAAFPGSSVEYATFEGVGHVPVMYAGQRVWLDWVADRFASVPVAGGCRNSSYGSVREVDAYLKDFNYFLEPVTSPYQIA